MKITSSRPTQFSCTDARKCLLTAAFLMLFTPTSLLRAAEVIPATTVVIDGSSTVYPMTVAIGEQFAARTGTATCEVLCSGSSAGIRRLLAGEVPISGASRPMKASELAQAAKSGIEIIELPIAYDGLSVVVNKHNNFIDTLTVDELKRIWEPDSKIKTWNQVRPTWPALPVMLFGPGKDSGTFDYFTEVIVGKARSSREDYVASEDDHDLVQGIVKENGALGYFGMAYLHENESMLRGIPIDGGKGAVPPTVETVADGTYRPLSRPLFLYVNKAALARLEVQRFLEEYLTTVAETARQVGYVPLDPRAYTLIKQRFDERVTGSLMAEAPANAKLIDLLDQAAKPQSAASVAIKPAATSATVPTTSESHTPKIHSPSTSAASSPANTASIQHNQAVQPSTPMPSLPVSAQPSRRNGTGGRTLQHLSPQLRDRIQDEALRLARSTLSSDTAIHDIRYRLEALLTLVDHGMSHAVSQNTQTITDAEFQALVQRLVMTNDGKSLLTEEAFDAFKSALNKIDDQTRRTIIANALSRPTPDQVPEFAEAISTLGVQEAELAVVLCYARGGFTVQ